MRNHTITKEFPVAFFALTFLLAVPFYILNVLAYLAVWIFNNAGKSVFAAILFHAADNTALVTLPEIQAISPWGAVLNSGLILVVAGAVTWLWGPRTLARFRFGK